MSDTDRPVTDSRAAEIAERTRPRPGTWDYVEHGTRDIDALLADRAWCGEQIAQLQGDEKDSDGFARNAEKIILAQAAQIAALVAERDALRAKLETVLLCANCGAAAVAATAEQENP